jgi:hypothetical protein
VTVKIERPFDCLDDPERERDGPFVRRVIKRLDDRELVAAQSRQNVGIANGDLEALGHLAQQLIAGRVPERVVDLLEPVEVEREHCKIVGDRTVARLHRTIKQLREVGPVWQPGEQIVLGKMGDLALTPDAIGDVFMRRQPAAVRHGMYGDRHDTTVGQFLDFHALADALADEIALGHIVVGALPPSIFQCRLVPTLT